VSAELTDVTRQSSSWLRLAARHAFLWLRGWKPEQKQATLAALARGQPHAHLPVQAATIIAREQLKQQQAMLAAPHVSSCRLPPRVSSSL
jgi:hypothetical protein